MRNDSDLQDETKSRSEFIFDYLKFGANKTNLPEKRDIIYFVISCSPWRIAALLGELVEYT